MVLPFAAGLPHPSKFLSDAAMLAAQLQLALPPANCAALISRFCAHMSLPEASTPPVSQLNSACGLTGAWQQDHVHMPAILCEVAETLPEVKPRREHLGGPTHVQPPGQSHTPRREEDARPRLARRGAGAICHRATHTIASVAGWSSPSRTELDDSGGKVVFCETVCKILSASVEFA